MNRAESIASVLLTAFGLAVAWYSREHLKLGIAISPGAGFLPFYVGLALAALGLAWFVATFLARHRVAAPDPSRPAQDIAHERELRNARILTRFLPGVALILAYAWVFEKAGYFASTVLFMVAWQKGIEREGWVRSLVVALVCAAAMYALFSFLLKGVLPSGTWFS